MPKIEIIDKTLFFKTLIFWGGFFFTVFILFLIFRMFRKKK